ncbi:ROK family protein [Bacillaceae bacterium S4-13-58]
MKTLRNGSKELIKEINRFKVLNIIRLHHPISRAEIAKRYKLGASTLSYIIEDLMSLGYITEIGESDSTGGRRAKLIQFNKDYGYAISLKIEEKQILLAVANMEAELVGLKKIPFKKNSSPEVVVDIIENNIKQILAENNIPIEKLLSIGILSSGLVNRRLGIILRSTMLGWNDVPITSMLKKSFKNTRIFVDNNINGYTLAELWSGEGQNSNNFLVVSVGAGLGLSVVIDRKIYYGSIGGAGEFGHTTIEIDGYTCHCGQKGCLEMYASEFFFENKGKEIIGDFSETTLEDFSFTEVATKAEKKDELAMKLIHEMGNYLGYGVRNLINTFNPDKIVLAGEGMSYSHLFLEQVMNITGNNFFSNVEQNTEIVKSELDDNAWLVGGALLAIDHLFEEPIYENEMVKN